MEEIPDMYLRGDNEEVMIDIETDKIVNELSESLLMNYQESLGNKIKGSNFIFGYVRGLSYLCHKFNLNHSGSYIDSVDWIKN